MQSNATRGFPLSSSPPPQQPTHTASHRQKRCVECTRRPGRTLDLQAHRHPVAARGYSVDCVCVCVCERERERGGGTDTHRHTDRHTHTQSTYAKVDHDKVLAEFQVLVVRSELGLQSCQFRQPTTVAISTHTHNTHTHTTKAHAHTRTVCDKPLQAPHQDLWMIIIMGLPLSQHHGNARASQNTIDGD